MTPKCKTLLEKLRKFSDVNHTFARVVADHGPRPCPRAACWAAASRCLKTRVKHNKPLPVVRLANRKIEQPWLYVTGAGEAEEQGGRAGGEANPILPSELFTELMGMMEMR